MTDQQATSAPDPLQGDVGRPEPAKETAEHPQPPPTIIDEGMRTGSR
jgi:hypothetical protein